MLATFARIFGFDRPPPRPPTRRVAPQPTTVAPAPVARVAPVTRPVPQYESPFPPSKAVRALARAAGHHVVADGLFGDVEKRALYGLGDEAHSYVRALLSLGYPAPPLSLKMEGNKEHERLFMRRLEERVYGDLDTWEAALAKADREAKTARDWGREPERPLVVPTIVQEALKGRREESLRRLSRGSAGQRGGARSRPGAVASSEDNPPIPAGDPPPVDPR